MKSLNIFWPLVVALTGLPVASSAQQLGYAAKEINLRAGPSRDYPVVAVIGSGVSFVVDGCVADYRWCDVTVGQDRGWVYAGNIIYSYQGASVPLLSYGAALGIGIIAFSVGDYWDSYYRNRPWYPQRQRWMDRPQPVFRPQPHGRPGQVMGHPEPNRPRTMPGMPQSPGQDHPRSGIQPQPQPNRVPPSGMPRPFQGAHPTGSEATQHNHAPDATRHVPPVRAPAEGGPQIDNRHPADAAQGAAQGQPQRGARRAQPWEEDPTKGRK
ncbi:SH3 domain-containing protein [Rhodoferax sp.]|uniref:SH3 domain-containing protein n=1 Tax=Rhodoferax sp. TaxID=50421 RepID=UPI00284D0D95|nr:SH3 domain-containing protein [Rhodoferax sp.]MDR3367653.1 SH3 domain-containing protein [Rhodoferax sp.]